MSEVQAAEPEVLPKSTVLNDTPKVHSAIVVHGESTFSESDAEAVRLMGFIVPAIAPEKLRYLFAQRQRLYAAILDENDYIYTIAYPDPQGRMRTYIAGKRADAEKFASLNNLDLGDIQAKPKKSGVVKLARALQIEAQPTFRRGLPDDSSSTYSYVVYEAVHAGTGTKEVGVGWCDRSERGGRISTHEVIATADTRAYNRAILRCSGFGEVSADEIISNPVDGEMPRNVPEPNKNQQRRLDPLPPINDPAVMTASRAWAEAITQRESRGTERFVPAAQQASQAARMLRARSRRGDAGAATNLGSNGYTWSGPAQDEKNRPGFDVEEAPVKPEAVQAVKQAAQGAPKEAPKAAAPASSSTGVTTKEPGWNLSGDGSAADDAPKPTTPTPNGGVPLPDTTTDVITVMQAKTISQLLKANCNDNVDACKAWLAKHARVNSSKEIRSNQYEPLIAALKKEEANRA